MHQSAVKQQVNNIHILEVERIFLAAEYNGIGLMKLFAKKFVFFSKQYNNLLSWDNLIIFFFYYVFFICIINFCICGHPRIRAFKMPPYRITRRISYTHHANARTHTHYASCVNCKCIKTCMRNEPIKRARTLSDRDLERARTRAVHFKHCATITRQYLFCALNCVFDC